MNKTVVTFKDRIFGSHCGFFESMTRILQVASGGASKSQIEYAANMDFKPLNICLDFLLKRGLVNADVSTYAVKYRTTAKGQVFLKKYEEILNMP